MSGTEGTHNVDYAVRNREMFYERQALNEELVEIQQQTKDATDGPDAAMRARTRRLERQINALNEEIFEFNKGLVLSYVRKFSARTKPEDTKDLESAGLLGLASAVASYNPELGTFAAWAHKPIKRQVLRAVRDLEHQTLRPGDFERRAHVLAAIRDLQGDDPLFQPSEEDIAMLAELPLEQVQRILRSPNLTSLSAPVGAEDSDGELGDLLPDGDVDIEDEVLTAMSVSAVTEYGLTALDRREQFVIVRRWGLDGEKPQRLASIGKIFGLSREAVRQIEAKALSKMGHPVVLRAILRHGRA